MLPKVNQGGLLPPGVHWADWDEIARKFGHNSPRRRLLNGLKAALENLKNAGCGTAYTNGSFVTGKELPNDFDACWEEAGVDPYLLDPILLTFDPGRAVQKSKYFGELFPASAVADVDGTSFIDFFRIDKNAGEPKEIVAIDLGELT